MDRTLVIWGIVLIVGFPLLNLLLGEIAERLERGGHSLARGLQAVRKYLMAPLAALLVMRIFFALTTADGSLRIVETIYWAVAAYTALILLSGILTPGDPQSRWQLHVPNLFFQVARTAVLILGGGYILQGVWGVNLSNLATALGVGSLVIALALQDTLSGLVSGFLLAFDRPFKIGDWITVEGIEGEVVDQNWRAVRISTIFGKEVVIPNSLLGGAIITNPMSLQNCNWRELEIGFSYDNPPNQVKHVIGNVMNSCEGVLKDPPPIVLTLGYEEYYVKYFVAYAISNDEYERYWVYEDIITTRIYYAARRNGLKIPFPINVQYNLDGSPFQDRDGDREGMVEFLRSLPDFSNVPPSAIERASRAATLQVYGLGDRVVTMGEENEGLYIIYEGRVTLTVLDRNNRMQEVTRLGKGDIFGEMALLPGEVSPVTGVVEEDLKTIVIDMESVNELIQSSPKFAREMNQFIEDRWRSVRLARGDMMSVAASNGNVPEETVT